MDPQDEGVIEILSEIRDLLVEMHQMLSDMRDESVSDDDEEDED